MELFYAKGYEATSVAEILERADAGSGSLYYFFKDKGDLALAVAEAYLAMLYEVLFKPLEHIEDPIERIFGLLAAYRANLVDSSYTYGCPIGNLALEIVETLPAVAAKLDENFREWTRQVRLLFEQAADRFPPGTDFESLATLVLTTMEGGVMLSRTSRSPESFDRAVAQLRSYIDFLTDHS
jgi:TetR/AcrR family transcriptional regulator, transcriptional repressor for nem operon